jgi:zinc D-Ala-D-Ala carboxypeptidase
MSRDLLDKLTELRKQYGKPMIINSAARCPYWNKIIKGAKRSQHLLGRAVDIRASGEDALLIAKLATDLGFGGVEIGPGFIHVDTGPKRDWKYLT